MITVDIPAPSAAILGDGPRRVRARRALRVLWIVAGILLAAALAMVVGPGVSFRGEALRRAPTVVFVLAPIVAAVIGLASIEPLISRRRMARWRAVEGTIEELNGPDAVDEVVSAALRTGRHGRLRYRYEAPPGHERFGEVWIPTAMLEALLETTANVGRPIVVFVDPVDAKRCLPYFPWRTGHVIAPGA